MTPNQIPRNKRGQYAWDGMLQALSLGESLTIRCESQSQAVSLRTSISARARALSLPYTTRHKGLTITLLLREQAEKPLCGTLRGELASAQAREANLPMRILEAKENAAYWQRQIHLRELPDSIQQARANHAAWKMTATRLAAQLAARQPVSA